MKLVDAALLAALTGQAASSSRGRANHNLHPELADPVQRFLNAMEPGTYVRPHRHPTPRWELFVLLAGAVSILMFDGKGAVIERLELQDGGPLRAVELPALSWHTVVCQASATVLFEVKPGPYEPLADKDFAPWAPEESGTNAVRFAKRLQAAQPGDRMSMLGARSG